MPLMAIITQLLSYLTKCVSLFLSLTVFKIPIVDLLILGTLYQTLKILY